MFLKEFDKMDRLHQRVSEERGRGRKMREGGEQCMQVGREVVEMKCERRRRRRCRRRERGTGVGRMREEGKYPVDIVKV